MKPWWLLVLAPLFLFGLGTVYWLYRSDAHPTEIVIKPRISFYHYFSGPLSGGLQEMVDLINKRNTSCEVVTRAPDHEAYKSLILSMAARDRPPELFSYWAGMRVQSLVEKGVLSPLDDVWEKDRINECFSPSIVQSACTYQGKKYLLPLTQYVVVFFYDKKRFAEYGLQPPKDWDEFLTVCRVLKEHGQIPLALGARERWPAQFWFDYLLLRTAGPEYRQRLMDGRAHYSDREVLNAVVLWKNLIAAGYFNTDAADRDWAEATESLCSRKAGMTLMGSWALQAFRAAPQKWKEGVDYDFFAFPVINKNIPDVLVGPIDGLVMPKKSPNQDAARALLPQFVAQEAQEIMSRGSGCLVPNTRVPRSFYEPLNQRIWDLVHETPTWAFNYDLSTPAEVAEAGLNGFLELLAFPDQYDAILEDVEQQAQAIFAELRLGKSPKDQP